MFLAGVIIAVKRGHFRAAGFSEINILFCFGTGKGSIERVESFVSTNQTNFHFILLWLSSIDSSRLNLPKVSWPFDNENCLIPV